MAISNVKFGQGGRLYADATRESDGLPWDRGGGEDDVPPLPNKVVPKVLGPAASPPASSARSGSSWKEPSTFIEVAGMGLIGAGFFMISPALGMIVSGVLLVVFGLALDGGGR